MTKDSVVKFFKTYGGPLFYRLEWTSKDPWGQQKFVFHPRVIPIRIGMVILLPFILIWAFGVAVVSVFTEKWKTQDWTSYTIGKDEKKDWRTAYSKL